MSAQSNKWFADACRDPFAFLVERYGFTGPIESRGGNEFTARYQKRNKTIAISVEPFGRPVVEMFTPTPALENRRILVRGVLPPIAGLSEEEALARDLRACALNLESNAREFLSDEPEAQPAASTNVGPAARHGTSLTICGREMKARILTGAILGLAFGFVGIWVLRLETLRGSIFCVAGFSVVLPAVFAVSTERTMDRIAAFFIDWWR